MKFDQGLAMSSPACWIQRRVSEHCGKCGTTSTDVRNNRMGIPMGVRVDMNRGGLELSMAIPEIEEGKRDEGNSEKNFEGVHWEEIPSRRSVWRDEMVLKLARLGKWDLTQFWVKLSERKFILTFVIDVRVVDFVRVNNELKLVRTT